MTELLLRNNLRTSQPEDEVRAVANTLTLSSVRTLDPVRKGLLLRFLFEAQLIEKENPICGPEGINLCEANLIGAYLKGARLEFSFMKGAKLNRANLKGADLRFTGLNSADLEDADLEGADLMGAILKGTNLKGANLDNANLELAVLEGANLEGANLRGTIMPDGKKNDLSPEPF
jgi:uncharacterized protein YjbI with pentapeptide repeats